MQRQKRNSFQFSTYIVCLLISNAPAFGADIPDEEAWVSTRSRIYDGSAPAVQGFSRAIIRKIETNNTPVKTVVNELCKRGGVNALDDKSLDGKTITTHYTDATVDEVLSGTFTKSRLQSRFLTDNLLWVEAIDPPSKLHQRVNIGDTDNSAPFSIEEQKQAKLRAERRAKALRQARLDAQLEAQFEARQEASQHAISAPTQILVPPPPPYTPSITTTPMQSN